MFDNNRISIFKGNTAQIQITPVDSESGDPVILGDDDVVLFTVKNKIGRTVIQKHLTKDNYSESGDSSINCEILPEDTINLPTGEYPYDCLFVSSQRAVTFISSYLTIKEALGLYTDAQ